MREIDEFALKQKTYYFLEKDKVVKEIQQLSAEIALLRNSIKLAEKQRADGEERQRKMDEARHQCTELLAENHGRKSIASDMIMHDSHSLLVRVDE